MQLSVCGGQHVLEQQLWGSGFEHRQCFQHRPACVKKRMTECKWRLNM